MKTEAKIDGQCECGHEEEGTFGQETQNRVRVEAICQIHRPHIEVGESCSVRRSYTINIALRIAHVSCNQIQTTT